MSPAALQKHFEQVADAPEAVARLRQFILDLAVRGKLVEQDPNDRPGTELLEQVEIERKRLLETGPVRRLEEFDPVAPDEFPFPIPPKWTLGRMGWLASKLGAGSTPLGGKSVYQSEGIPFLRSQNVHNGGLRLDDVAYVSRAIHSRMSGTHVQRGDILLNITGASIGRCALVPDSFTEGNVSQHVAIIRLFYPPIREFIHLSLIFPFFQKVIDDVQVGVSREGLSMQRLRLFPMLLPPLAEQHRIVAKVDELMALCDELEAAQQKRESRRDRLVAAALHALNNGDSTPEENSQTTFADSARFYINHLPCLTTRPEHIKQLRQTILNLAVRGRLVPQEPDDEPGVELLRRVQAEKARLLKCGMIRKEKDLEAVAKDEMPFDIPMTWTWARIGICSLLIEYGTSVKSDRHTEGIPVLKMGDIQNGRVLLGEHGKIPRNNEDLPKLFLKRSDLLYNRTNSAELVGKTGVYLGDNDAYTFASYLIRIRLPQKLLSPLFVNLAMNAPYFRETQIVPELKQQCGQANVNGTKLRNMLIPLPPLAEQHRIVAKVDEQMALCDELEAEIANTTAARRQFLEVTLANTLKEAG